MDLTELKQGEIKRHPWELARLEVVKDLINSNNLLKEGKHNNILDIGCGDTYLIEQLSVKYTNATFYAIDIAFTDEMLNALRSKYDQSNTPIKVYKTLDDAVVDMEGKSDLVLLLDVIEHIEDDKAFLNALNENKSIDESTNILITVPAFQSLYCSHDDYLKHYRRYTNKTLRNVLKETGFEKQKIGYFFTSLIPPRIIQVIKEKVFPPKEQLGIGGWNGSESKSNLLKSILFNDYKIMNGIRKITGIKFAGLSNYIISKKK